MKRNSLIISILVALAFLLPAKTNAMGLLRFESDHKSSDNRVPIDGGIVVLLAAGIGYGAKKVMDKRKKANADKSINL